MVAATAWCLSLRPCLCVCHPRAQAERGRARGRLTRSPCYIALAPSSFPRTGIGTLHCALVVPMSALAMHQRSGGWNWLSGFDYLAPNLALETRVTEVSVGYFLADFVHFILFEQDVLMFFHHLFSVLMIGSAGVVGRGGSTAVAALFQGEITNPFQSAWTVAKAAKATRLLNILSPLFTAVFVSVRLLLVPLWVVYINAAFLSSPSRSGFPQPLLVSWSVMSAFMTLGGFAWSWALVKGLRKFYKNKSAEAKEAKEKQHKSL